MDGATTVELGALALSALRFVREILKDGRLKKAERKKLESEAKQLVQIAQMSDIDAEASKASIHFRRGRPSKFGMFTKKTVARKAAPKTKLITVRHKKKSAPKKKK